MDYDAKFAAEYDRPDRVRARKAQKLRALASLAGSIDRLRVTAHHLGVLGADHDAHALHTVASCIEQAFDSIKVPDYIA